MIRPLLCAALLCAAPLLATSSALAQTPGPEGPLDISARNSEMLDSQGRLIYWGDVNMIRGDERLRADRVEAFFDRRPGGGMGGLRRVVATGEVFYVRLGEIARGDNGIYDLEAGTIILTGSVVLTQGCNVSTGDRLEADLDGGIARLSSGDGGRVRSIFFTGPGDGQPAGDCPLPAVPGEGPRPFPDGR
jgi:lipopolysaccharide export system protein LptA